MENLRAADSLERRTPLPEEWRPIRDRRAKPRMPRVNMLLVGPGEVVEKVLETLATSVRTPVVSWRPGERFVLPLTTSIGTMIFRDVDALALADQRLLLEWLERVAGRTQVVSTASAPLMPRVEAGTFLDVLYYRLNTIYMDVTDQRIMPWDK